MKPIFKAKVISEIIAVCLAFALSASGCSFAFPQIFKPDESKPSANVDSTTVSATSKAQTTTASSSKSESESSSSSSSSHNELSYSLDIEENGESSDDNSSSSESSGNTSDDWKELYKAYLNTLDTSVYSQTAIIFLDDDNIPELYLLGKFAAAGASICWISGGEVKSQACAQTFGYNEGTGVCYGFYMKSGGSQMDEYTLSNGNLTDNTIAQGFDSHNSYTWNGESLTYDEYWDKYNAYTSSFTSSLGFIETSDFDNKISFYM